MAQPRQRRAPMAEINVVPYIDVMLVLLVIFMITAPLLSQGVKVDLPQAASQPLDQDSQEPLVVTVAADGRYYINVGGGDDVPVDGETIVQRAAAVLRRQADTPVLVRGDENVNYGQVVQVMTWLQAAGAPSVGLMTEAPEQSAGRK